MNIKEEIKKAKLDEKLKKIREKEILKRKEEYKEFYDKIKNYVWQYQD